jgi:membrane-associated phospholipid phosphatase
MTLTSVLASVVVVTIGLTLVGALVIIGPAQLRTLWATRGNRLRAAFPYVALLAGVLLVNSQARSAVREFSWTIGIELTMAIYALEGDFVPWLQSHATPPVTAYLSFQYIYGYIFLLVFPLLAYIALDDREPFRMLSLAYTYNYAIGLVLYVLVIAYGPRNLLPGAVESLLYTTWPSSQLLTTQMNTNTNVFPSLHTSLATTVVLLAYQTRSVYPSWFYLSAAIASSVILATLYLGIHWGLDALAGVVLAIVSVAAAGRFDPVDRYREYILPHRAMRMAARLRDSL